MKGIRATFPTAIVCVLVNVLLSGALKVPFLRKVRGGRGSTPQSPTEEFKASIAVMLVSTLELDMVVFMNSRVVVVWS